MTVEELLEIIGIEPVAIAGFRVLSFVTTGVLD